MFLDLRAELVVINDAPNGRNINVKCGSTHPEILAKSLLWVMKQILGFSL